MRWTHATHHHTLGNAVAAHLPREERGDLRARARAAGAAVLAAAGIDVIARAAAAARRGDLFRWRGPAAPGSRPGASSWQSLARATGAIEADHLNGEIVLLGRMYGVPTPVNATLQRLATRAAHDRAAPGSLALDQVLAMVEHGR
jgi:2-dehydropantoate 2-reductase